jgi:hypothetical protein
LLDEQISRKVNLQWQSAQNASPCKLHPPTNLNYRILLPRKFRLLRALGVACWYLPDWLKWEIILQIGEKPYSLDFANKGLSTSVELLVFSLSKEKMVSYCSNLINPRKLFGTILQEDLKNALKEIRIIPTEVGPVVRPVRRKGYKDKGTCRPGHRWINTYDDDSFIELQNTKEKRLMLVNLFLTFYRKLL